MGVVPGTAGQWTGDRTSVARHHHRGGESAQPGPTGPDRGDPRTTPRAPSRDRTEEAATTHPTPPRHRHPTTARPIAADPAARPTGPPTGSAGATAAGAWSAGWPSPPCHPSACWWPSPPPAFAAGSPTLNGVISNLTNWLVGILAGVATLFLTIGGLRYLTAGGDPGQVEKAKTALKSAAIGYALAILAPLLVSILASLVGG